ncbi:MAG: DUF2970 domain-containing protein [Noviherbaspirillum sp.]
MAGLEKKPGEKRTFLQTVVAILWSFIGLRRRSDYEHDAEHMNPVYVIIAGLLAAVAFIVILVVAVKFAVAQ